ncbi:hypothetical protein EON81_27030 [bacterium]|nr:MAG: hypothetical protein EON81_27030 [bacterium]
MSLGFDFIKLDFMSHGALEGDHFDPKVPTGTAAYRVGMQRIVDNLSRRRVGRDVFISLSIAPMFPHGYGHSRRISCDVFANIGATEYLLNSSAYGWWTNNRLYRFNDPDHTPLYQPLDEQPTTETEARTRLNATVISGGLLMESDDMTNPLAKARVKEMLGNQEVLDLARRAVHFRSAWGDTGSKASDAFSWLAPDGKTAYVALFNFDRSATKVQDIPLARLGLPAGGWIARDVWTTEESRITGDRVTATLLPTASALVKLRRE